MKRNIRKVLAEKLELRAPESAEMLTSFEVARYLRVGYRTLTGWRIDGGGPPFLKLSRSAVRYPRRAFERYLSQHLLGAQRDLPGGH